ncbi:MAG: M1 family aminopeptidase, partial [Candidatus Neomarinimicrobiota bacterium]
RLALEIEPATASLSGSVEVRGRSNTAGLQSVVLDFLANMAVDGVGGDADSLLRVGDRLHLHLAQPRDTGESFTVRIDYHGQPASTGFGGFRVTTHGDPAKPIVWTLSEPYGARNWWPCKDVPSDKADSVDIIVTVPDGMTVASNGVLRSASFTDSTGTFHWHESYPITTYLVSLAITNYRTYSEWFRPTADDSLEVRYYIYPENLSSARTQLTETLDMLAYFHEIFGPYPFWSEKYGIAQFPWGGGMEHQTITSQGGFSLPLTVHELAHQWWGDKITTATWHDIWLNEGFASYAEALYFEHTRDTDYFRTYLDWMDRDYTFPIYVDDTTSVSRIFDGAVYDKAGWFLHMLRHVVGDPVFFDILLAYSHDPRFAYGNATTAGFQAVCETVSGMVLDWFFQPWIYEVGRPVYRAEWGGVDSAGTPYLALQLEQTQVPARALFPMPIDLTIATAAGDTVVTIFNDQAVQTYTIELAAPPTAVTLDEDGWILKTIESVSRTDDRDGVPAQFALSPNYPNPFNPATRIDYDVPVSSFLTLAVYNVMGQELAVLVRRRDHPPGKFSVAWNGRNRRGQLAPAGVYLYRLEALLPDALPDHGFVKTRKLVLLR